MANKHNFSPALQVFTAVLIFTIVVRNVVVFKPINLFSFTFAASGLFFPITFFGASMPTKT